MLKLKKLTLNGIGRFVETQTIDFSSLGHLVQLGGQNNNTGGSSGAGKTTVFAAIDYLFGLNVTPNSALQSRLTKDAMTVTAEFDWDGKAVEVSRGKKLSVTIAGNAVVGSNKLAEEELDKLMGMPRELFRKILHKRQKEGGFFLQFTPKETHEFMADALGIGNVLTKVEKVEKSIKDTTALLETTKTTHFGASRALESTRAALAAMGPGPAPIVTNSLTAYSAEIDRVAAISEPMKQAHRLDVAALELIRPKVSVVPYDYSNRNELTTARQAYEKELQGLLDQDRARKTAVNAQISSLAMHKMVNENIGRRGAQALLEAQALGGQIKTLQGCQCPTCEQSWATPAAKAKEEELKTKAAALVVEYKAGKEAEAVVIEISRKVEDLNKDLNKPLEGTDELRKHLQLLVNKIGEDQLLEQHWTQKQNYENQMANSEFQVKQRLLQERHNLELSQINLQAAKAVRDYDMAKSAMENYERDIVQYQTMKTKLTNSEQASIALMLENERSLSVLEHSLKVAEEAKRALKSFASCAFDDALEEVSEMATRLVRAIPTMATATISLEGTKETKEGKVKEEVNAVISMDGDQNVPIKTLSGGERSSVDLAIDLAVIDLLENKTNKGIDTFLLDEPFTGLDTVGIEMALEVLKGSNAAKRLVIVDHNPEAKQMIESQLLVIRDGLTSRIEQG